MNKVMSIITGEFFLNFMPNGGKAVLFRSAFVSSYMYIIAIAIRSYTSDCAIFEFSSHQLRAEINETIPWLGAIFGGTYAALYSRFSSQWAYLADLYNQQVSAALSIPENQLNGENFSIWQAAFVEDAVCMHLATKPGFSNAILGILKEERTKEILEDNEYFGKQRVIELIASLEKAVKQKL